MVHRHGLAENGGSICTIEKASNSQKETNGCLQHTMMAISKLWWVQTNLLISSKELSICIGQIDIIPHYIKSIIQNIMIAEKTHFGGNASAERGERKDKGWMKNLRVYLPLAPQVCNYHSGQLKPTIVDRRSISLKQLVSNQLFLQLILPCWYLVAPLMPFALALRDNFFGGYIGTVRTLSFKKNFIMALMVIESPNF